MESGEFLIMPIIEEFDVVIKTINIEDIKQLFGEGRKDVRVRLTWDGETGPKTFMNPSMKLIVETWEPKKKEK